MSSVAGMVPARRKYYQFQYQGRVVFVANSANFMLSLNYFMNLCSIVSSPFQLMGYSIWWERFSRHLQWMKLERYQGSQWILWQTAYLCCNVKACLLWNTAGCWFIIKHVAVVYSLQPNATRRGNNYSTEYRAGSGLVVFSAYVSPHNTLQVLMLVFG